MFKYNTCKSKITDSCIRFIHPVTKPCASTDRFYQIGMDGGHGYGYHALHLNNHSTVAGTLDFDKYAFLTFELTTCYAHLGSFGQIDLFGQEIQKLFVVSTGYGYEAFHLVIGNNDLLTAAHVDHVLQERYVLLHFLNVRRKRLNKN